MKELGIKVFEIIDVPKDKAVKIHNKLNLAEQEYKHNNRNKTTIKYNIRPAIIKVKHLCIPEKDHDFMNGRYALTEFSECVWWQVIELSDKLKRFKCPQGKYLVYWKKGKNMVWIAFLTEKRWLQLKGMILGYSRNNKMFKDKLTQAIAWSGSKALSRLGRFLLFYKPGYLRKKLFADDC